MLQAWEVRRLVASETRFKSSMISEFALANLEKRKQKGHLFTKEQVPDVRS